MRSLVLALAAILSLVAAGCVQPPLDSNAAAASQTASALPAWVVDGVPSGEEHDHEDPAQHAGLSTPNFEVLGNDPLVTDRYQSSTNGMGCGGTGVTAEGRKLALVHTISTEVAFIVADVTDPAHPQKLGEYLMPNAVIWDATITPDGKHALVGAYPPVPFGDRGLVLPPPLQITYRDACTGAEMDAGPEQYLPFGPGIVMIGLQDPTKPAFEDWVPQPVIGPHSVTAHAVDGKIYATSSVTNLVHDASYYSIFEVLDTPGGGKLVPLSVIQAPGPRIGDLGNGHVDVYIAKHPVDNKVYAWLANWNDGMRIYDITNPRAPIPVSQWRDPTWSGGLAVHTTYPLPVAWGGKHYTLVGQEGGPGSAERNGLPSLWVYVIDDTDPAHPIEVGRWTLPIAPRWDSLGQGGGSLRFSPHYVGVLNTTMFVANYHGGLWAVDISDPTHPDAVGLFVPDRVSPQPFRGEAAGPSIEDVLVGDDGVLTVWSADQGVYLLRYDERSPMAKPPRWPFEYPTVE